MKFSKALLFAASVAVVSVAAVALAETASTTSPSMGEEASTTMMSAPEPVASTSCPLSLGFMKLGAPNKGSDVLKLQTFLNKSENAPVDLNGVFDQKTEQAVEAFQRKYMSDIMGPWGATKGSGIVYITTAKKIDQIACGVALSLDPEELAVINAYKDSAATAEADAATASGTASAAPAGDQSSQPGVTLDGSSFGPVASQGADSGQAMDQSQTAAAASSGSLAQRFWAFVLGLFGR